MSIEKVLDRLDAKASVARKHRDRAEADGDRDSLLIAQAKADAYDEAYQAVLEAR